MKVSNIRKYVEPLYDAGYDLIPLSGKRPVQNDWVAAPKLSLAILQQKLKTKADNVGMRLGRKLPDGRYLCVLDVDVLGSLTPEEATALNDALETVTGGADLSSAPCVKTGYGNESRHVYVATSSVPRKALLAKSSRVVEYEKTGATKSGPVWKIELMGYGAQVVIPPSIHPDTQTAYRWIRQLNGTEDIPTVALQGKRRSRTTSTSRAPKRQSGKAPEDVRLSSYYQDLLTLGDVNSDYPSRSEALYAVLTVLVRDTQLDDEEIADYVLKPEHKLGDKARETNDPKGWLVSQIVKVRDNSPTGGAMGLYDDVANLTPDTPPSAIRTLLGRIAESRLPSLDETRVIDEISKKTKLAKRDLKTELTKHRGPRELDANHDALMNEDDSYRELFERHVLVNMGGKPAVFRKRVDPYPWESMHDVLTLTSLTTMYENKTVTVGNKRVNPVDLWRTSAHREEYPEGAVFSPALKPVKPGYFNLFQGYAAQPKEGDVSFFLGFIEEIICDGNKHYTKWLLDWVADLFQDPINPKGVAIVLRGGEGIGKGTFANALGYIVGPHFRHITQESQLTGRFNSHFADSSLIFADEMTWGGDKRNRGSLYALVTERFLMIERKNFDAIPMRNLNRMIIASNNSWVVPTNVDGRRWFVLDCAEHRKGDTAYFKDINAALSQGGYDAILHYFLHRKIKSDLRRAPATKGLTEQKELALDSVGSWWYMCIETGKQMPLAKGWKTEVDCNQLYSSYTTWCNDHHRRDVVGLVHFGRRIRRYAPSLERRRGSTDDGERFWEYVLPDYPEAQAYMFKLLDREVEEDDQ